MSWFNRRKVTVDTKKECDNGHIWTLIDNEYCVVKKFFDSRDVVKYLYDEKVQHEVFKELEREKSKKFNKHFTFFLNKDVAPPILNKMDAMECVEQWEINQTELFNDILVVKYDASRQVLFQTENGAVLKED